MEKVFTQEERIKRAEEIYNRRKNASIRGVRVSGNSVNNTKNKLSLFKKMFIQLIVCAIIYSIFYVAKNTNYIFSENFINKTKEVLSYDINFNNVYKNVNSFIEKNKEKFNITGIITNTQEENILNDAEKQNNIELNNEEQIDKIKQEQENLDIENKNIEVENKIEEIKTLNQVNEEKSSENTKNAEDTVKESIKGKTQMELDSEYIKNNFSFQLPLKGTVTSKFGERQATEIVSAYHQGIDIGADIGTNIYASMEGKVTLVSEEGDYRKTFRDN